MLELEADIAVLALVLLQPCNALLHATVALAYYSDDVRSVVAAQNP